MSTDLYPLRFEPIFQYRLWGGRRLANVLSTPLPGDGPIGEAWVLSDRDDFSSVVADGPLKGTTITQLVAENPEGMLGALAESCRRFPLLLKFLDAREMLSVQVHPSDGQTELLPPGERGKTEAWVVLEADPGSTIFAGLKAGTTPEALRGALADGTVGDLLHAFTPRAGDGLFIPAGTVHALGGGVMVFEVQENSDVTFRIHDWGRIDAKTGQFRELHVAQALACIDFDQGEVGPVVPVAKSPTREQLFDCSHFELWRTRSAGVFDVGAQGEARVLVCLEGAGAVGHQGAEYGLRQGEVMLLPAAVGRCACRPHTEMNVLEIALPQAR